MLENLTCQSFIPHLNSVFRVGSDAEWIAVELVEVSEPRLSRRTEAFSLVFRGPSSTFLQQAMYRFQHAEIGDLDLFIVPIGRDEHGLYYEAVFNNLRP
jgi:hypothetical protein